MRICPDLLVYQTLVKTEKQRKGNAASFPETFAGAKCYHINILQHLSDQELEMK